MAWAMICTMAAVLLLTCTPICYSAVLQAAIEIDTGVDDFFDILMKKFDPVEKGQYTKKGTTDLATTLLNMFPLLSIRGNITEKTRGFKINFSFQAASETSVSTNNNPNSALMTTPEDDDTIFQPIVETVQPYLIQVFILLIEGILGVIIERLIVNVCVFGEARI